MTWVYEQHSGRLRRDEIAGFGYSGFGAGKNNPELERVPNVGPIPTGRYRIGLPFDCQDHGPVSMHLDPLPDTATYGRVGFMIQEDSGRLPGFASRGGIVLARDLRELIGRSDDRTLEVI